MPNFNGQGSPGFLQGPKGLMDMLASALRGATMTSLGLPGDIEGLGRMGINALGGNVNPEPILPNSEYWNKTLPPATPMSGQGMGTFQELGQFLPGPTILQVPGMAAKALRKATGTFAPAAREQVVDQGRRQAMKAAGAAAVVGATAPQEIVKALRAAPATAEGKAVGAVAERSGIQAARAALTAMGKKLYQSHGSKEFERVVSPDEMLLAAKEHYPNMTDEGLADGLQRFGHLYQTSGRKYGDITVDKLESKYKGADDWTHSALEDIFVGKLDPNKLSQDALNEIGMSDSPLSDLVNSLSGVSK